MSIALTPTSYLVLGYLATAGPSTPYELKQAVSGGVGYFWAFPHSQLYSEPARLAEAGLVKEEREDSGRRRRVFSIATTGRVALREWLAEASTELPEIRDIALLKLFFGAEAERRDLVALAEAQRDAHVERLALYEDLHTAAGAAGAATPVGATLELGLAIERATAAFWTSLAAHPPAV